MTFPRTIATSDVLHKDLKYIETDPTQINQHGTRDTRSSLMAGELVLLMLHPKGPLILSRPSSIEPSNQLYKKLQHLRLTGAPPVLPAATPIRKAEFVDPEYEPEPVVENSGDPYWSIVYRDELNWNDQHQHIPVRLEPSVDKARDTKLDKPGSIRQPVSANVKVHLYPDITTKKKGSGRKKQGLLLTDGPKHTLEGDRTHSIKAAAHRAAIVYPSLTTPALLFNGDALNLVIIASDSFKRAVDAETIDDSGSSGAGEIGPLTLRRIHNQLLIQPYSDIDKKKPKVHQRLYKELPTALDNIKLQSLGEITPDSDQTITDPDGMILGILDRRSLAHYHKNNYRHLYHISLCNLSLDNQLCNLQWLCPDNEYDPNVPYEGSNTPCHEPQDHVQNDYLSQNKQYKTHDSIGEQQPYAPYVFNDNDDPFKVTTRNPQALQSSHPVFVSDKPQLNPGQLSDIHISSRQSLYTQSNATVIPSANDKHSPNIGAKAHNNLDSLQYLLEQLGEDNDVDIILITGDIHDHSLNADPTHEDHTNIKTTGDLWRAMNSEHHKTSELYPSHIDSLMMLSLIQHSLITYGKPILYVDGNHEAYNSPYGISPRVTKGNNFMHGTRANAGIPADHNLTIYEACLLYGPEYYYYDKANNFDHKNQGWLRNLLSPWKDWVLGYGKQQTWIGLCWGETEDIIGSIGAGGGALPRANDACNNDQLALIENAVDQRQAKQNILLTHFTFVNYATSIPLQDSGNTDTDNVPTKEKTPQSASNPMVTDVGYHDRDNWEEGSFYGNRDAIYNDYLLNGKIHYTFSGHSHRAGAYVLKTSDSSLDRFKDKLTTQGHYPDGYTHDATSACLLVTGSGGPITWQNQQGEYAGYAMEQPQGLKLNTQTGHVKIIKDTNVKPRMAVLLEYLWYEGGLATLKHPFTIQADGRTAILQLEQSWIEASEHGAALLDTIRLHIHTGGDDGYQGYITFKQSSHKIMPRPRDGNYTEVSYRITDEGMSWAEYNKLIKRLDIERLHPIYFVSIHCQQIKTGPLHDHYDYDSPWCFPVVLEESGIGTSLITRHDSGDWISNKSDVPDFKNFLFHNFRTVYDFTKKDVG